MDIGIISMRYAKALLAYAREHKAERVVYKELKALSQSFETHPALKKTLDNPVLPAEVKLKLLCSAVSDTCDVSEQYKRFMQLVLKERRENFLQFMCMTYIGLYRKLRHIGVGKLITAVPVDDDTRERFKTAAAERLHARMELQTAVDPSIEGGFIFDINGYRLDASIATQLKKVKQQYIDKNRRIV